MGKLYKVTLTSEERQQLIELVSIGKSNAQKIKHASLLTLAKRRNMAKDSRCLVPFGA